MEISYPHSAEKYLRSLVQTELLEEYGLADPKHIDTIVSQWMDDQNDAAWRFAELLQFQPGSKRILDMACGCGTAIFWGLLNGFDMYGLDPNFKKHQFLKLKIQDYQYSKNWQKRFILGVGEALPYSESKFDSVMSYQTLEHVQNPKLVILELIRVTRMNGFINLRFPDYRSTFEGHYMLPWLPLFPKIFARLYLKILGRRVIGLNQINYLTPHRVIKMIRVITIENPNLKLELMDGAQVRFFKRCEEKGIPKWRVIYLCYKILLHIRCLFRRDIGVNLFIKVVQK